MLGYDARALIPEILRERRALERELRLGTSARARRFRPDAQTLDACRRLWTDAAQRPLKWRRQ
jgi:hypothetical protein